ncbi:hypothetical protein [Cognatilysobacter segetis]|uniref:hypothetical protein n=1 Tax=Cognatilysobacter segetis TaxID=2492394 RepID=UPI0010623910|nr:hypothetical protein [Lysobacter segetis]
MKTSMSVFTFALGLGLLMPASPDAHASFTGIQKCRAPDGTSVYTDKPCSFVGAKASDMSADLGMRLASEAAREPEAYADAAMSDAVVSASPAGRRSLQAGCARTPTQLAMDIEGSIGLRDVNRLAESWQWAGMTQSQATPVMKRLERLAKSNVQSTRYFDAQIGFGMQLASADNDVDGRAGILQVSVGGENGMHALELNVERYAGCYFVHF